MNNDWVLYLLIGIIGIYALALSVLHIRLLMKYDELLYEHSQYEYAENVWNNEIYTDYGPNEGDED